MASSSLRKLVSRMGARPIFSAAAHSAGIRANPSHSSLFTRPHIASSVQHMSQPTKANPRDDIDEFTELARDFVDPEDFYLHMKSRGLDFFTGVPDSLLKDFCAYISDNTDAKNNIVAANEGTAVGIASGYYLSTGKFPVVYLQNSGIGNAVNPLLSLCHKQVYSIPMLLFVGWRGEPGKKDEPQHLVQGKLMPNLLSELGIAFEVLPDYIEGAQDLVDTAVNFMETRREPFVVLVKRQTFSQYKLQFDPVPDKYEMTRERAIDVITDVLSDRDVVVSATGMASRELYELRVAKEQSHASDFLTVGSMGHCSSISLGIALQRPGRQVLCLDGDGSTIMHMGAMATAGLSNCKNFKHVIINNAAHDSVGGQPTFGFDVDFLDIARACGYKHVSRVTEESELAKATEQLMAEDGPALLEVRVKKGGRKNLGRPKSKPGVNREAFMKFVRGHGY